MLPKVNFERLPYNWAEIEAELDFLIPDMYKEFYEKIGSVSIDDFIYIVNPTKTDHIAGLKEFKEDVTEAYLELETFLDKNLYIQFLGKEPGWLPVGYTTNGDFIFCDSSKVMVTDEAFEEREIYDKSLYEFIELYLNDDLVFTVLSDGAVGDIHKVLIGEKTSFYAIEN